MDTLFEIHPACAVMPDMDADEFWALRASIRNGFDPLHPIVLYEGQVLDGRHRYLACQEEGVTPTFTQFAGDDPYDFVRREHEGRRSWLSQIQKALVCQRLLDLSTAWQATRQAIQDNANRKRSKATQKQHAVSTPRHGETMVLPESQEAPNPEQARPGSRAAAAALNVNRDAVEKAAYIRRHAPDLATQVEQGTVRATDAIREIKRAEIVATLEDTATRETKAITGVYDVVVIDPPWPMQKIERDERSNQSEFPYPTMTEEEMQALALPMAEDCHVWLWTTHKFLPMAFRLLAAWDVSYVCCFTWHKPGGFQPFGLPQYNSEFCLYARRGTPQFVETKAFPTCFSAPRGAHSAKPANSTTWSGV